MKTFRRGLRIDGWKWLWSIAMLSFFGGVTFSVFSGDEPGPSLADAAETTEGTATTAEAANGGDHKGDSAKSEPEATKDPVIKRTVEGCLADSATLEDLKRQKRDLEMRQKDLAAREAELKAREQALAGEIGKLSEVREEISKIDGDRKKENEAKVAKLVETIESMNPKAAAGLVAAIDETLAVQAISRLSTAKLAKILNIMDPARSTKLSELLAGVTRVKKIKHASPSAPGADDASVVTADRGRSQSAEPATAPAKGGDQYDGKSHEQANNRSTSDAADSNGSSGTRRQPASGDGQKVGEVSKR